MKAPALPLAIPWLLYLDAIRRELLPSERACQSPGGERVCVCLRERERGYLPVRAALQFDNNRPPDLNTTRFLSLPSSSFGPLSGLFPSVGKAFTALLSSAGSNVRDSKSLLGLLCQFFPYCYNRRNPR